MEQTYAQALTRLARNGMDDTTLVQNLVAHLKRTGRLKLLPAILRALKRQLARDASVGPNVEVAHKDEAVAALAAAKALGISVEAAQVNPALLSGWRATDKGKLVDRSGKRALVDLYERITRQ